MCIAGLNMVVCSVMGVLQLLMWIFWSWFARHPARYKVWFVALSSGTAMLLEIYDFPPIWGIFDAHSLWHAATIPLTFIWWSFVKEDAILRTYQLTNSVQVDKGQKGR
ncbi:hypothetical protein KP509_1Z311100 [Ceratopteris richardii]|nr:hypothetical protein KP509_1Z311100 [Ceratopteris richardii]